MTIRVGINGFGRIGRQVLKAIREYYADDLDVIAFNDLGDLKTMAHLFRYDSNYGVYPGAVEATDGALIVDGDEIKALSERDPAQLPWGDLGVDLVIESTGIFRDKASASKHIAAGAKKVIISAPAKGEDITIVLGVNQDWYDPASHHVLSNASCTTNCLAPGAKVVNDAFGIQQGFMTTIHSYTNDQMILDLPHSDPAPSASGGGEYDPDKHRRCPGSRSCCAGIAGKIRWHGGPRTDAYRFAGGFRRFGGPHSGQI